MNSLKRQASKDERYAKLRDEMRAKLRVVLASKFTQMELDNTSLETQIGAVSEEMRAQAELVQLMEVESNDRTQRGYGIETEIRENRDRLNQVKMDMDRAQARRRHNEERCNDLVERSSASGVQMAQARERLGALEAERNSNQLVLDSAADELAAAQRQMELYRREAADAVNALSGVEHEQEVARASIMETVAAASTLRNQLGQAAERLAALDRESQRLHAEMQTAN